MIQPRVKVVREEDVTRFYLDDEEWGVIVFAGWYGTRDEDEQRMFREMVSFAST